MTRRQGFRWDEEKLNVIVLNINLVSEQFKPQASTPPWAVELDDGDESIEFQQTYIPWSLTFPTVITKLFLVAKLLEFLKDSSQIGMSNVQLELCPSRLKLAAVWLIHLQKFPLEKIRQLGFRLKVKIAARRIFN